MEHWKKNRRDKDNKEEEYGIVYVPFLTSCTTIPFSLVFRRVSANKGRRYFVGDPDPKQCSSGASLTNFGTD